VTVFARLLCKNGRLSALPSIRLANSRICAIYLGKLGLIDVRREAKKSENLNFKSVTSYKLDGSSVIGREKMLRLFFGPAPLPAF
jgi:hypothetical protein